LTYLTVKNVLKLYEPVAYIAVRVSRLGEGRSM